MAKNELQAQENNALFEYDANGEKVKLSASMVRKYLVSGGGQVTDGEVMMFLSLCRYQHLNPFLKEAYLIKFGNTDPATIVTGKDVFTKRADSHPSYSGKKAGVTVIDANGKIIEREGSIVLPKETLVGGWAKVFIKGRETPEYASVNLEEYIGKKKSGEINSNWQKRPATMIRKVAVVHALREAFPDRFQGLYAQEEFSEISDMKLSTEKIVEAEVIENANTVDFAETVETVETVEGEVVSEPTSDLPDFMKAED